MAPRIAVQLAMKIINPGRVEERRNRRLHRRDYISPGPNFVWHIDGYDKLKPYGFPIHGAIDGFSRKVLWLNVGTTNNNPLVTAVYFVRAIKSLKKVPCIIRCDRGTEKIHIENAQKYLRRNGDDTFAGENSFIYGKSTGNQRIEAWWSILRRQCTSYWINCFKGMEAYGLIDASDPIHIHALRFCFMHLIHSDLRRAVTEWNTHHISSKRNRDVQKGIPDMLYFIPEQFEASDFSAEYDETSVSQFEDEFVDQNGDPDVYDDRFVQIVDI